MIGIDVSFCWDNCNFLLQTCPHSYVSKIFGILRELHYFVVSSQTIETSYKSSSSSSSHTSKFGFCVNESPLFTNEEDHLILYLNLNDVFIKMCLMPLSLRIEFQQAWNEWLHMWFLLPKFEYAKVINFFFLHHAYNNLQTIIYYSKIFTIIQTLTSCAQRFLDCKGFGFV
jgi:hypothetical protein